MHLSSIANQLQIEALYHSNNQKDLLKQIIEESGVIDYLQPFNLDSSKLHLIKAVILNSLLFIKTTPEALIPSIAPLMNNSLQDSANLIEECIDRYAVLDWDGEYIYTKITYSKEVQQAINNFGYPLPLNRKPKRITNNYQSGYYTSKRSTVMQSDVINPYDVNLDFLNQINSIPLRFNNALAKKVPLVRPKKQDQLVAHTKFIKHLAHSRSLLADKIYLTHGYDRRGRTYARGYHYNYQSCDWNKATLSFFEEFKP